MYIVAMKLAHRHALSPIFIFLIISCTKPKVHNNEITKVELARMGVWADPGAAISVDTSLNYKYYGSLNEDYSGKVVHVERAYYTGKVSKSFWDTLNCKVEKIGYRTLDTADNMRASDVNYFELIIHWKTGKRRIIRMSSMKNDSVLNTINWLNDSYKGVKLQKVKDFIKFETKFQYSPVVPAVKMNHLKNKNMHN